MLLLNLTIFRIIIIQHLDHHFLSNARKNIAKFNSQNGMLDEIEERRHRNVVSVEIDVVDDERQIVERLQSAIEHRRGRRQ